MLRFSSRCWPVALATMAALAATVPARADLPCAVRLTPPDQAEWRAALDQAGVGAHKGPLADCRSIHVAVLPDNTAVLEFITTDGRVATRHVEGPAELAPAIEALLVTVSPSPATPPPPAPATAAPPPAVPDNDKARHAPTPLTHLVLDAGVGGRITLAHKYAALAVSLQAAAVISSWEFGVFGEWDPVSTPLAAAPPSGFALSMLDVGAMLGRREHVGRFEVACGVDWGIAAIAETASANAVVADRTVDGSQQRFGGYVGLRFPRDSSTRFMTQLWVDSALSGLRRKATAAAQLPGFPRFGGVLSLGIETVAL